jgi:hypothetical protein
VSENKLQWKTNYNRIKNHHITKMQQTNPDLAPINLLSKRYEIKDLLRTRSDHTSMYESFDNKEAKKWSNMGYGAKEMLQPKRNLSEERIRIKNYNITKMQQTNLDPTIVNLLGNRFVHVHVWEATKWNYNTDIKIIRNRSGSKQLLPN